MFEISITDSYSRKRKLNKIAEKRAEQILRLLKFKSAGLGVLFVGDRKMAECHQDYMGVPGTTDVISFSHLQKSPGDKVRLTQKILASDPPAFLGDIVICLSEAKRRAIEYEVSFEREWSLYLCHGILHLIGYDDMTPSDKKVMFKKQDEILSKVFKDGD